MRGARTVTESTAAFTHFLWRENKHLVYFEEPYVGTKPLFKIKSKVFVLLNRVSTRRKNKVKSVNESSVSGNPSVT